jgi:hypothetical protein
VGSRGEHDRVGQRAGQAGLVAVGEDVAADVEQDDDIASQLRGGVVEVARHGARPWVGVDQQDGAPEDAGHAALGEAEAAGARGLGPGEPDRLVQALVEPLRLVERARTGQRVDGPPLPGDAAGDGRRAQALGEIDDRERTDDVAAAADADARDARGVAQADVGRLRRTRARRRSR